MENLIVILICCAVAGLVTLVGALLTSERVRRHGLLGALRTHFSATSRLRNPYQG
jgi:hypothetical protein